MNGKPVKSSFSDFMQKTTSSEGPVRTEDIPRQRYKPERKQRKKRKHHRASQSR
jgi:hypothetical protein